MSGNCGKVRERGQGVCVVREFDCDTLAVMPVHLFDMFSAISSRKVGGKVREFFSIWRVVTLLSVILPELTITVTICHSVTRHFVDTVVTTLCSRLVASLSMSWTEVKVGFKRWLFDIWSQITS